MIMARRRFIPTDFWESPTATSLSAGARLFLLGCWTVADDEGLLRWDADEFKERFFGSDDKVTAEVAVTGWMQDLIRQRLVLTYRDRAGATYGYLLGFERDHKVPRPVASTLPPPNPRHSATINAYAWRDKGICGRCNTVILPIPGARQQSATVPTRETGIIVPTDHDGPLFPSQALVVHQRCLLPDSDTDLPDTNGHDLPEPTGESPKDPESDQDLADQAQSVPAEASGPNAANPAAEVDLTPTSDAAAPQPVDQSLIEDVQESLFSVPEEMAKVVEPARKKKRKDPATWTPDRKEVAHAILRPWWVKYGEGWPQGYNVVFGIIISVLANKVPADDITKAMDVLGTERKPISGGTITFALSHPSKKVREQEAFKERSSAASADKYQQRTL
jgi:hypothetical protein